MEDEDKKFFIRNYKKAVKQKRTRKEVNQARTQHLNLGFKRYKKLEKEGKTEYQRKVAKSLRE